MADDEKYCILRFRAPSLSSTEVIDIDLTLEEAQAHCQNPSTREEGVWFDGYTDMDNVPDWALDEYREENG